MYSLVLKHFAAVWDCRLQPQIPRLERTFRTSASPRMFGPRNLSWGWKGSGCTGLGALHINTSHPRWRRCRARQPVGRKAGSVG